ncbi:MAG: hypothetical protein K5924_08180 [Chloroflexi bacterium]|nr:hypothetical protein [Chloroflexota bacterium]
MHPRTRALREALQRAESIGPLRPAAIGLAGGLVAAFIADGLLATSLGTPVRQLADAAVFGVVMGPLWLAVQPADVRRAHDVMTWLNGWETERWQTELGRRLTTLPRATPSMVDSLPDTLGLRPLRVELLAATDRLDEARERLEQLPVDTPWQRFERAALDEWIAWWADAPDRHEPMRRAAMEIDEPDRQLAARAMIAAAEARRAAGGGGDAVGPLAALREDLGDRPRRYAFGYTTGVVVMVALTAVVASITISVASAIIR